MKRLVIAGVALVSLAGCATTEVATTTGPPLPATSAELQEAVRLSAQQVLDSPGFTATSVTRDRSGNAIRSSWLDYRTTGDYFLAVAVPYEGEDSLIPVTVGALIRVGEQNYGASRQTAESEPWSLQRGGDPDDLIPIDPDIADFAAGAALVDPRAHFITITRQQMDGGASWNLEQVVGTGRSTQEWQIDAAGWLQTHTVVWENDTQAVASVTSFREQSNPQPISAPEVGSPLDVADYRVPERILSVFE